MSPLDPLIVVARTGTAFGHLLARRHDEASKWSETAFRDHPNYFFANVICACTRAVAGRSEDARSIMERVRETNPTLRISNLRKLEPLRRPRILRPGQEHEQGGSAGVIGGSARCMSPSMANSQIPQNGSRCRKNGRLPNSGAFSPRVVRDVSEVQCYH